MRSYGLVPIKSFKALLLCHFQGGVLTYQSFHRHFNLICVTYRAHFEAAFLSHVPVSVKYRLTLDSLWSVKMFCTFDNNCVFFLKQNIM